jgi:glycosyltransferase involved in cell wall biosynthesis
MVSFQRKLAAGLARLGLEACFDLSDTPYAAILVIGGTRHLAGLYRAHRRGIPIIQRLDGMNWLHRIPPRLRRPPTGWRHVLRAEYGNALLKLIRTRLADRVVYQSQFARRWWERVSGRTPVPDAVIYNGVDLGLYMPDGPERPPEDHCRVLLVEGSLMGGYEQGLQSAVLLAERLLEIGQSPLLRKVELLVVGRVAPAVQRRWEQHLAHQSDRVALAWAGQVPGERIPAFDRSAHLLYSADIHPACPNSVIEALACGLPVVSFDTGALPELVTGDSGRIAPYGGDSWRLDPPDVGGLARAAGEILSDLPRFRLAARLRAETAFGLDAMVQAYLDVLM